MNLFSFWQFELVCERWDVYPAAPQSGSSFSTLSSFSTSLSFPIANILYSPCAKYFLSVFCQESELRESWQPVVCATVGIQSAFSSIKENMLDLACNLQIFTRIFWKKMAWKNSKNGYKRIEENMLDLACNTLRVSQGFSEKRFLKKIAKMDTNLE